MDRDLIELGVTMHRTLQSINESIGFMETLGRSALGEKQKMIVESALLRLRRAQDEFGKEVFYDSEG